MHPNVVRRRVLFPVLHLHHPPRFRRCISTRNFNFTKFRARNYRNIINTQTRPFSVDRNQMINDRFARKDERLNRDRSTRSRVTWCRVTWRFACALRGRCARFFLRANTSGNIARLHNSPCSVNMRVIVIGQGLTATSMTTMMMMTL